MRNKRPPSLRSELQNEVSVATLRASLPKYIRRAQGGDIIRITNFKKAVALLAPLPTEGTLTYREPLKSPTLLVKFAKKAPVSGSFSALEALRLEREDR